MMIRLVVVETLGKLVHFVAIFPLEAHSTSQVNGAKEEKSFAYAHPYKGPVMADTVKGGHPGVMGQISKGIHRQMGAPSDKDTPPYGPSLCPHEPPRP